MTIISASEAIATLMNMAQQGEIDPWNVQVIEVIDRFLSELGFPNELDLALGQANLPQSGQAFLWASMLVLYKADTLERLETEPEELIEDELLTQEDGKRFPLFLEKHLHRRTSAPPPRKRRVTLEELITQLQQIAEEIETLPPKTPLKRPRPQSRREALDIITQLAHQENLTELAEQLEGFLGEKLAKNARISVDFEELVEWWQQENTPPENSHHTNDRVALFWALLLLSSQSKVELSQKDFYQDLTVHLPQTPHPTLIVIN